MVLNLFWGMFSDVFIVSHTNNSNSSRIYDDYTIFNSIGIFPEAISCSQYTNAHHQRFVFNHDVPTLLTVFIAWQSVVLYSHRFPCLVTFELQSFFKCSTNGWEFSWSALIYLEVSIVHVLVCVNVLFVKGHVFIQIHSSKCICRNGIVEVNIMKSRAASFINSSVSIDVSASGDAFDGRLCRWSLRSQLEIDMIRRCHGW